MSQPLFGLVPAGQPVIVTPTEVPSPTTFLFAIPPAPAAAAAGGGTAPKPFSHIVVFLLPGVVLPEGTAAAIYLVTPPSGPNQTQPNSKFLGGIGPGKESAIFKLGASQSSANVVIGISVEPADSIAARIAELSAANASGTSGTSTALVPANRQQQQQQQQQQQPPSTLVLAQRIIKNAFNFLASFSGTAGQVEVVPLKAFEEWWKKFENRVRTDPGFLERDG
ncbi:hypothetical protein VTK56DRAFT_198 [Thermocarpiscus australiensis]